MKDKVKTEMIQLLNKRKFISFDFFTKHLNISISTIKRYCQELERQSYLEIIRGGVKSLNFKELSNLKKQSINLEGKRKIAQQALKLIEDHNTIFLDAGTSVMEIAKIIPVNKNITIFTNSIDIIPLLNDKNIATYLIGGKVNYNTSALTGSLTNQIINSLQFNLAFIGCNGYDDHHIYTTNLNEALIKKTVINNSVKAYVLADNTKANRQYAYKVIETKKIEIIK